LGDRAEHPVRDAAQERALLLEHLGVHACAWTTRSSVVACVTGITGLPATTTRAHALPWPSVYLIVRQTRDIASANAIDTTARGPNFGVIWARIASAASISAAARDSDARANRATSRTSAGNAASSPPTTARNTSAGTPAFSAITTHSCVHGPQSSA